MRSLGPIQIPGGLSPGDPDGTFVPVTQDPVTDVALDLDYDGSADIEGTFQPGVTVRGSAALPEWVVQQLPAAPQSIDLEVHYAGPTQLSAQATLVSDAWTLFETDAIPSVRSLSVDSVDARIAVSSGLLKFQIGGQGTLGTVDSQGQDGSIAAQIRVGLDTSGALSASVGFLGLWKEPMWLPEFGVQSPFLELGL